MEALLNKFVLALSIGLQVVILFVLIKRRLLRRFFWFSIYIGYVLIEAALRLSVAGNIGLYFKIYWLTDIGTVIFAVLAVRESFLNVFGVYTRFRWFTRIVWGCVGMALLYSVYRAWVLPPVNASRLGAVVADLELAVNYSLAFVGILYFLFVKFQKIREHQWESAIISGFSTIGILSSIAVLARSVFGPRPFTKWIEPVAYILAEIEWALVLGRPERETPKWVQKRELTIDDLTRLDQYIRALERILGRH